jgi:hypothetical protein
MTQRKRTQDHPYQTAKPDNPEQFKRFLEMARELGAEEVDDKAFGRVLEKVARSDHPKPEPKTRRPRKPKDRA